MFQNRNKKINNHKLLNNILGPDLPTGCEIILTKANQKFGMLKRNFHFVSSKRYEKTKSFISFHS